MKVKLTAINGSHVNSIYEIEAGSTAVFGRTSFSTHSFPDDQTMSGRHFEVANDGSAAVIRDLGSSNGLYLNRERITESELLDGYRIRAGTTEYVVEIQLATVLEHVAEPSSSDDSKSDSIIEQNDAPLVVEDPPVAPEPEPPKIAPRPRRRIDNPLLDSLEFEAEQLIPPASDSSRPPSGEPGWSNPLEDSAFAPPKSRPAFIESETDESQFDTDVGMIEIPRPGTHRKFQRMTLQTEQEAATSLPILLDALSGEWCIALVLHFKKIRNSVPAFIQGSQVVIDWMPTDYAPICVNWRDFVAAGEVTKLLPRLCSADACLAFLGKNPVELESQILEMQGLPVDGFSEEGGLLMCYWPSSLTSILAAHGGMVCNDLFGQDVAGVLYCTPGNRRQVTCVGNDDLCESLNAKQEWATNMD